MAINPSFTKVIATCSFPCRPRDSQQIWFQTLPVTQSFCFSAAKLQLITYDELRSADWDLQLCILQDGESMEPRTKDGNELLWESHRHNGPHEVFGPIFDHMSRLLRELQPGNVIGIRAVGPNRPNKTFTGKLLARVMEEEIFTPNLWTWQVSGRGEYISTAPCDISADDELRSIIWFTTPPLNKTAVSQMKDVRLTSGLSGRLEGPTYKWQGCVMELSVMILPSLHATIPKTDENGKPLEWQSHSIVMGEDDKVRWVKGKLFDRTHDLYNALKVGDVIAARISTQSSMPWSEFTNSGYLTVNVSTEPPTPDPTSADFKETHLHQVVERLMRDIEILRTDVRRRRGEMTPNGANFAPHLAPSRRHLPVQYVGDKAQGDAKDAPPETTSQAVNLDAWESAIENYEGVTHSYFNLDKIKQRIHACVSYLWKGA